MRSSQTNLIGRLILKTKIPLRILRISYFTWVLVIGVSILGSGCAIGDYGSLVSRYTHTKTATVMDVYSLGLQMRTFQHDRGATLGYRRSSYIFIQDNSSAKANVQNCWMAFSWPGDAENDASDIKTEWCLFQSPTLDTEILTRASTSAGIELQYTKELKRLNMGYLDQTITVGPKTNESIVYKLDYTRNEPKKTKVFFKRYQKGENL